MQQSLSVSALPGTWKLAARQAMTLQPCEAGILRVAHGRLWATYDGPHAGAPNDLGDRFLEAGSHLRLQPGQRLVIEAWSGEAPACFTWEPVLDSVAETVADWTRVLQPLADLRRALAMAAAAAARLVAGVAGLVWGLVAGHPPHRLADHTSRADQPARDAHAAWVDAGRATC
jgi:hypothetical protein